MRFKLIIAFVDDTKTELVLDTARKSGAKGATVITQARGEGIKQSKTFFGLTLDVQRDVLLFLVEEHLSRYILEKIAKAGEFDTQPGSGIAFKIDVEDAIGVMHQVEQLTQELEDEI
ncbi:MULTISPECIES: P-II family nitrogen regulator [Methylomonas]|uniref:P-II family nitrogen regulator n=2 Tax=Methylomonas TaxID=416 RepID=A0ABT1U0S1_9GAMM|nr:MULTISPECIES: P-II family nitrogen regulator [unclassified Methylomonas]MCQ8102655.1 P-II family nitrogen regulator [Methylomonas sp. SURF-2]MCQ8127420.1 P-II family nitrogen regulator [Methylomonas sp. WSC-6]